LLWLELCLAPQRGGRDSNDDINGNVCGGAKEASVAAGGEVPKASLAQLSEDGGD
jgi:hypothetical protein